ncbi:2Fe-2S iron-sulfur cluster-binding protein [Pseudanabaena sp. PCC 6802]|uniref:2Fe-2S iron-sulfur cluster-binding protein n=1 Tax=Pseudanabaena sp. PCC 6802 TaxID=118173 RepID=UPI00034BB8E5
MAVYQVRLLNPSLGLDRTIAVPDDEYIQDMAIAEGIRLPAGCRQGNCSACIVKVAIGEVDQSEQKFLRPEEIAAGYAITCVAYALSDCTLETHQEGVLYKSSLYAPVPELKKSESQSDRQSET